MLPCPSQFPVLSPDDFIAYTNIIHIQPPKFEHQLQGPLPQIYADMFGWPEMVQKTAAFYNTLTPDQKRNTAIWGDNYGVASALDFFGPRYGLPPAIGPHQSYFIWGPRSYRSPDIIKLGAHDDDDLRRLCDSVQIIGRTDQPLARPSEHFNIYYCRGLHYDLQANWPRLKRFD